MVSLEAGARTEPVGKCTSNGSRDDVDGVDMGTVDMSAGRAAGGKKRRDGGASRTRDGRANNRFGDAGGGDDRVRVCRFGDAGGGDGRVRVCKSKGRVGSGGSGWLYQAG